jgi:hypothetical protein
MLHLGPSAGRFQPGHTYAAALATEGSFHTVLRERNPLGNYQSYDAVSLFVGDWVRKNREN